MKEVWLHTKKYGNKDDRRIKLLNHEEQYKHCKYNTSKCSNFIGYCDHPQHHYDWGYKLIKCKKFPCEKYIRVD